MSSVLSYPVTNFTSQPVLALGDKAVRERLSQSALLGFFNIMTKWRIRDEDAKELLGGVSNGTFYDWKKNPDRLLDVDKITRISYLIGIYKGLHIIYGDKLADEWVCLPNKNSVFRGLQPLAYMLTGGLLAMHAVRSLIDARRGGI